MKKNPHPTDIHIGKRLRLARLVAQLSQQNVADMLGVTYQQVQKYENGRNRFSGSMIAQAAKVLKVKEQFFFDNLYKQTKTKDEKEDDAVQTTETINELLSGNGLRLLIHFKKLPASYRHSFLEIIRTMAQKHGE